MKKRLLFIIGAIFVMSFFLNNCATFNEHKMEDRKFFNPETSYQTDFKNIWEIAKTYVLSEKKANIPSEGIPINPLSQEMLEKDKGDSIYRLGHSTILLHLDNEYILLDPVFSERASPMQWMGPKRFHPNPISIEDLPSIKMVVISHNHYDHLDQASIEKLAPKVAHFVVPLGIEKTLLEWGIEKKKIIQLDWWQNTRIGHFYLTATPAQHFSGRGLWDRDKTLWASWVIESSKSRLFFSGDSGYFTGFKEIGKRFGPFDVTMIETGAYHELWKTIHMLPEQSIQAHIDLRGKAMIPIHNSTFDLSLHDWYEPLEKSYWLAREKGVRLLTPKIGARVKVHQSQGFNAWWQEFKPDVNEKLVLNTSN